MAEEDQWCFNVNKQQRATTLEVQVLSFSPPNGIRSTQEVQGLSDVHVKLVLGRHWFLLN